MSDEQAAPAPKTPPRRSAGQWLWGWVKSLAAAFVVWLVLRAFVVQAFHIPSGSMENTLLVGDVLFVSKALYGAEIPITGGHLPALREPRRGEILVFKSVEGDFDVVKRLIGMPGDTLEMRHGRLYRNGAEATEPYVQHTDSARSEESDVRREMRAWQLPYYLGPSATYAPDVAHWGPLVVPPNSYFMMGDNRDNSRDSRYWGFLPRGNVRGKPLIVYYSYDPSSWKALPLLTAVRWGRLFARPQ